MQQNFECLCFWFEDQVEPCTVSEFHAKMKEISSNEEDIYGVQRIKQKLQERYDGSIIFSDEEGKSNLVYLRDMTNKILSDAWYKSRNSDISEEKRRIIMTAASLLRDDIRSATFDSEYYPSKFLCGYNSRKRFPASFAEIFYGIFDFL